MKKLFGWHWENPLETWWKARKYFQFPTIQWFIGKWENCCTPPFNRDYLGKILDVFAMDVMWKPKQDYPSHELNPCIGIVLFRKWKIAIWFTKVYKGKDYQTSYWESILDFLYYGYDWSPWLACKNNVWKDSKGNLSPTETYCLKKTAYSHYLQYFWRCLDSNQQGIISFWSLDPRSPISDNYAEQSLFWKDIENFEILSVSDLVYEDIKSLYLKGD